METAEWNIRYGGPRLDTIQTGDDLSLSVLKGITASMDYAWDEAAELPNHLRLVIKNA